MSNQEPVMDWNPMPRMSSLLVKVKQTGQVMRWTSFDERTQMLTVVSQKKETSTIHRRDTETPSTDEELEFRRQWPESEWN